MNDNNNRLKQTCVKCRAYERYHVCSLGYKNDRGKPLELCPKPKTYDELFANQNIDSNN